MNESGEQPLASQTEGAKEREREGKRWGEVSRNGGIE